MNDRAQQANPSHGEDQSPSPGRPRRRFTVDSLFTDTRPQAVGVKDLTDAKIITLDRIVPDPAQPRRTFDPERLDELTASIRAEGVLQPIVVRLDRDQDRYIIVHGERRFRAARLAGLAEIPAIVRDVPRDRLLIHQLMENIVRDDLNAIDRASAIRALRGQLGDPPWEDVAAAVGIKRSRLFQLLGTEKLSSGAQSDIREGRLSEKQSRALQGLPAAKQEALRRLVVAENLPAAAATRLARAFRDFPVSPDDNVDAAAAALETLRSIVDPRDRSGMAQQSGLLLGAIQEAGRGSRAGRERLHNLVDLVGTPRFTNERFDKDLNAFSRTLAGLASKSAAATPEATAALRSLREAIDALLQE
ncbi:MAG TPA: ParB/RepB/Spo0J family partition protein [Thermomicrobiales bacterium]|nr:ParB/RepB/Spo0J family partition protein [Thermomicrobiales bacterium]